MVIHKTYI